MDHENNTSTVKADEKNFNLKNIEFEDEQMKEKCELIYEIKTICSMENFMTYKEFEDDCIEHSSELSENIDIASKTNLKLFNNESKIDQELCTMIFNDQDKEQMTSIEMKNSYDQNKEEIDQELCTMNFNVQNEEGMTSNEIKLCSNVDQDSALKMDSIGNESSEYLTDIKRISRRNSKRKKEFDECCPICGVTIRLQDLESHYNQEVEKLSKIPRSAKRSIIVATHTNDTYAEVKKNRENRLTARVAKYSARAKNEVKCPVCNLRMSGTPDEINRHVALCFQDEDSDAVIDVEESGEIFEEYEIGDETRIRPISLIPGGHRTLHGSSSTVLTLEEEALNIDVDGDMFNYGKPQYSELDVIPDNVCEKDKTDLEKLRKAVLTDTSIQPNVLELRKWSKTDSLEEIPELPKHSSELSHIVSSLREKIKDIEDQNKSVKCLICLESYTKPVVSTTCWHVHCEECWLMTMGVKKLCPQCNMIVFPSDLRKIYL